MTLIFLPDNLNVHSNDPTTFCKLPRLLQEIIITICSIQHHGCSDSHIEVLLKFKLRKSSLPVIPLLWEKVNQEKTTNREIVRYLIDIALFLSENNLAFRGHQASFKMITTN